MKKRNIVIIIVFIFHHRHVSSLSGSTDEIDLREKLFHRYSPILRPLIDQNAVLNVTFNMKLIRLLYVEEKSQEVTSQAYFSMKWHNDYLKWNPEQHGDITSLPVRPEQVWIPDIVLKNNANAEAVQIQRDTDTVWIKHTGKCSWYPKVTMRSSFKANVVDFPFDNQLFTFHFGSWSLGDKKLQIRKDNRPMIDKHYLEDAEWELIGMNKEILRTGYDSDAYIEIAFDYAVSRKPAYSVITAIAPSLGLMALTLFSYILPPNNGERIKVILTSLLAFTVFLVEMNGYLPRNSEAVPVIQMFYMTTMAECILCFIVTCIFARLFGNATVNNTSICVPQWVKYVLRIKREKAETCDELLPLKKTSKLQEKLDNPIENKGNSIAAEKKNVELTRLEFLYHIDHLCMKIFILMFFSTTAIILMPPYYRKQYSALTDSDKQPH